MAGRRNRYRVWHIAEKHYLGSGMLLTDSNVPVVSRGDHFELNDQFVVYEQFTDFPDCDGKDVIEGDALEVDGEAEAVFEVIYKNGSFGVEVAKQPAGTFLLEGFWALAELTSAKIKVVGNTRINPELLQAAEK